MAESKEKEASVATKTYRLKKGAKHQVIKEGKRQLLSEGAELELTSEQAKAFSDKLEDAPASEEGKDPATLPIVADTGPHATIVEANAAAGNAAGLAKDDSQVPTGESAEGKGAQSPQEAAKAGSGPGTASAKK